MTAVRLLLFATLTIIVSAQNQSRPRALEYVRTFCSAYSAIYEPLVADLLSQYQSGFSTADLLRMPANYNGSRLQLEFQGALPMLYIIDGQLWVDDSLSQPGGKRLKNLEYFGIPLLQQLSQVAVLPDLAMRYNPFDEPSRYDGADVAPWFCYCSVRQQHLSLLLPDNFKPASLKCPEGCQLGASDTRHPKAIFLGRPTGWEKGKRKAVLQAALKYPQRIYAGITGDPESLLSDEDAATFHPKPMLPLSEQVTRFKYIVNVEGNCAALRLKHLLAGPSLVFFVQSDEIEWFYPLLKPYKHYIPVSYGRKEIHADFEVDLAEKVAWAESNPDRVKAIVREANAFAAHHLSKRGQQCFAMQMINRYASMLEDSWRLGKLKGRANPLRLSAKDAEGYMQKAT